MHPITCGLRLVYLRSITASLYVSLFLTASAWAGTPAAPTFNKDILPLLQTRCQPCHRPGQMAPMPLVTLDQIRAYAKPIVDQVKSGQMPPWYSDKCCGQYSPEHQLSASEISMIEAWVNAGLPEGKKKDAPRPVAWTDEWRIDGPSVVVSLPRSFEIPANARIDDQFVVLPLDLAEDKWASAVEIHPGDRSVVHHAVLYVRTRESSWLRDVPKLTMVSPPMSVDPTWLPGVEILTVYSAGSPASIWPEGTGKKIPAGADLVLQIHYTAKQTSTTDRTSVGINFLKERPEKRVLTFALENRDFTIPPGAADYRASVYTMIPRDLMLIGVLPHMHQRGKAFEVEVAAAGAKPETVISSDNFDSAWQQSYPLKTPKLLPRGARLILTASYDNSAANRRNPDPKAAVRAGEQSSEESMVGYFDVAVDVNVDRIAVAGAAKP